MKVVLAVLAVSLLAPATASATIRDARIPVSPTVQGKALRDIGRLLRSKARHGELAGTLKAINGPCFTEGANTATVHCYIRFRDLDAHRWEGTASATRTSRSRSARFTAHRVLATW
jgi:hypothetical protein